MEQVISVAKSKFPNMLSKNLKSAVKSIVGTCGTLGMLVESKEPGEIQQEIDEGKYEIVVISLKCLSGLSAVNLGNLKAHPEL